MKEETKELIDWLKKQLAMISNDDIYYEKYHKAITFLNSLPEIESKLCHGGYIQDKNGTPCCHGDKVKFMFDDCFEMFGQLAWHFKRGQFLILTNSKDYELDRLNCFERVE